MKTAIIGAGAAGFFLAINLKERVPSMDITLFESSKHVLRKVAVSGGGRCNLTNTFAGVTDLSQVYPRGHRLLKRLFNIFSPQDTQAWFSRHGVKLTVQADQCVFPASQDAQTVVGCFLHHARQLGINIQTSTKIDDIETLKGFDFIAITTGGMKTSQGGIFKEAVATPIPSLFTFNVEDEMLRSLMGTVVEKATVQLPGTKMRAQGALLITHWGMSGPAILKLSSHSARWLHDHDYKAPLCVNWLSQTPDQTSQQLCEAASVFANKQLATANPFGLPSRLWTYLATRALGATDGGARQTSGAKVSRQHREVQPSRQPTGAQPSRLSLAAQLRWANLNRKAINRLAATLTSDLYTIDGRAPFKDEFVTCGGVELKSVNPNTLESRLRPRLYFAGEVLDIDGITGGFNFQAAWTTAFTVSRAIAASYEASLIS